MITKEIAIAAKYRQEFRHVSIKNADGTPARCRVNGKIQTWETRPDDWRLPVKYGFSGDREIQKNCFYITPRNAEEWE